MKFRNTLKRSKIQSMKRGNSIFISLIYFTIGAIVSYFLTQFSYLKVNTEVNITETLLSVITALIGLYIAVSIQKKTNRSQSLHTFLQGKTDDIWSKYTQFDSQIKHQSTINLSVVNKSTKEFYQDMNNIKVVFQTFNLSCACIEQLEEAFDNLENYLTNSLPINNNTIQLNSNRPEIIILSNKMHQKIAATFVEINNIL